MTHPNARTTSTGYDFTSYQQPRSFSFGPRSASALAVEQSLATLFHSLTLECSTGLVHPQWKHWKNMTTFQRNERLRLNNGIWRSWHLQYLKGRKPKFCQFVTPRLDSMQHSEPRAIVMEGKYWRRKREAVASEYRKWRLFHVDKRRKVAPKTKSAEMMLLMEEVKPLSVGIGQHVEGVEGSTARMGMETQESLAAMNVENMITSDFPESMFVDFPMDNFHGLGSSDVIQPRLDPLNPNFDDLLQSLETMDTLQPPFFQVQMPTHFSAHHSSSSSIGAASGGASTILEQPIPEDMTVYRTPVANSSSSVAAHVSPLDLQRSPPPQQSQLDNRNPQQMQVDDVGNPTAYTRSFVNEVVQYGGGGGESGGGLQAMVNPSHHASPNQQHQHQHQHQQQQQQYATNTQQVRGGYIMSPPPTSPHHYHPHPHHRQPIQHHPKSPMKTPGWTSRRRRSRDAALSSSPPSVFLTEKSTSPSAGSVAMPTVVAGSGAMKSTPGVLQRSRTDPALPSRRSQGSLMDLLVAASSQKKVEVEMLQQQQQRSQPPMPPLQPLQPRPMPRSLSGDVLMQMRVPARPIRSSMPANVSLQYEQHHVSSSSQSEPATSIQQILSMGTTSAPPPPPPPPPLSQLSSASNYYVNSSSALSPPPPPLPTRSSSSSVSSHLDATNSLFRQVVASLEQVSNSPEVLRKLLVVIDEHKRQSSSSPPTAATTTTNRLRLQSPDVSQPMESSQQPYTIPLQHARIQLPPDVPIAAAAASQHPTIASLRQTSNPKQPVSKSIFTSSSSGRSSASGPSSVTSVSPFHSRVLLMAAQASGLTPNLRPLTVASSSSSSTTEMAPVMTFTGGSSLMPAAVAAAAAAAASASQEFQPAKNSSSQIKTEKSPRRHEYKEHRRQSHISAEQKRRGNIKLGFEHLHQLLPSIKSLPLNKVSKASLLHRGADYVLQLQKERTAMETEQQTLRREIDNLNEMISICQDQLPATGVTVSRQRVAEMQQMFEQYVQEQTSKNFKFWIFSVIIRPLFMTFNVSVSTTNMEEFCRTVLSWLEQNCSLPNLRPSVLESLRELSTTTSILSDPASLPEAAVEMAGSRPL